MQKGKKKISENIGANRMLLKKSGSNNDTNNVTFFLENHAVASSENYI